MSILGGYHTNMGFRHCCRDSSAHGHDGEGKEGEDVLGVHFDRRGGLREDVFGELFGWIVGV